jgi:hypothetical protein
MIGKTIAEVVDRSDDYGGIDLIFTDGTAIRIEGDGYETSTVTQSPLTPDDREREAREKEERREAERLAAIRRAEREAEEAEATTGMNHDQREAWMDEHRPGWRVALIMKQEYQASFAYLMRASNRLLFGHMEAKHGGYTAVIPTTFKWEGSE